MIMSLAWIEVGPTALVCLPLDVVCSESPGKSGQKPARPPPSHPPCPLEVYAPFLPQRKGTFNGQSLGALLMQRVDVSDQRLRAKHPW